MGRVTVKDPEEGRGTAIRRQQRRVHVEPAVPRQVQQLGRQQAREAGHAQHVRPQVVPEPTMRDGVTAGPPEPFWP